MSTVEAVLLQGQKITPFERPWSTMTKMESKLWECGRSVMRSIEICWKGWVGWMGVHLIGLACGTAHNEFADKGGHPGPPIVLLEEGNCAKVLSMCTSQGCVDVFD